MADGSPPPPGLELIYEYTWEVTGTEIELTSLTVNGQPFPPPPGDSGGCSYYEGEVAAPPGDECQWVVHGDALTVFTKEAEGSREVLTWTRQ